MEEKNVKLTDMELGRGRGVLILDGRWPESPTLFEMETAFDELTEKYAGKKLRTDYRKIADALLPEYHAGVAADREQRLEIRLADHMLTSTSESGGITQTRTSFYSYMGIIELEEGRVRNITWLDDYTEFGEHDEDLDEYSCTDEEGQAGIRTLEALLSGITE